MRLSPLLALAALAGAWSAAGTPDPGVARGSVFEDLDADGVRDPGEPGLPGVRVSDGAAFATSGPDGRWELPSEGDSIFFVVKPRGFRPPRAENGTPRFHYVHRPEGSPPLRYGGVPPTGPLPASIDFALVRSPEPDELRLLLFGDTQPRDRREVGFMDATVVESVLRARAGQAPDRRAAFGAVLGDVVFDDLSMFGPLMESLRRVDAPWWMVVGNHDLDYDAADDDGTDETFARHFGPVNYSFDWGPAHFLVLDDVESQWKIEDGKRAHSFRGRFGERAMAYARADLAAVPEDAFVVVMMHIPLPNVENRAELLALLSRFPHTLSFAAHTHNTWQRDLGAEDGWTRAEPHRHVVNVTACGAWWQGEPDARGIPHATMSDGAPKGWAELTLRADGGWTYDFRGAELPADEQCAIRAPAEALAGGEILARVNVFAGAPETVVEARILPGIAGAERHTPWKRFARRVEPDPWFAALRAEEESRRGDGWRRMPEPADVQHLWGGTLLVPDMPGETATLQVRFRDREGRVWTADSPLRIAAPEVQDGR